jgi:DNA-binding NarL/FixJ family response regulator
MPKSNGLQTLAALKAEDRYAHLPVVIYSTYADEQLISNSKAAGAALVLSKPVSKKGYEEMIDAILALLN